MGDGQLEFVDGTGLFQLFDQRLDGFLRPLVVTLVVLGAPLPVAQQTLDHRRRERHH